VKKTDMKRHLLKKNKCNRSIESYKFKDNEIEEISMIPIIENEIKNINELLCCDINGLNKFNGIEDYILYVDKNNETKCIYCNKVFFRKYELKRHLLYSCKRKNKNNYIINESNNISNFIINNNQQINNQQINNQHINNQQINNIHINLINEKNIINSFDNDWDISNIDLQKKILLFQLIAQAQMMEKYILYHHQ
jgi:tRNA splicing endonuclease